MNIAELLSTLPAGTRAIVKPGRVLVSIPTEVPITEPQRIILQILARTPATKELLARSVGWEPRRFYADHIADLLHRGLAKDCLGGLKLTAQGRELLAHNETTPCQCEADRPAWTN